MLTTRWYTLSDVSEEVFCGTRDDLLQYVSIDSFEYKLFNYNADQFDILVLLPKSRGYSNVKSIRHYSYDMLCLDSTSTDKRTLEIWSDFAEKLKFMIYWVL